MTDTVAVPHRLAMGLALLGPDEPWLEFDADLGTDLREKQRLLSERRDQVLVELPASRPAQHEALVAVVDAVARWQPSLCTRAAGKLRVSATGEVLDLVSGDLPPLETAARCVQEDLCVMEKHTTGWCLTAAVVCFPTRWDLPSKLGRSMTAIHERVPGYLAALDHSANRFFDGMKAGAVFRRGNWSLMDDPTLFQPAGKLDVGSRGVFDEADGADGAGGADGADGTHAGEQVWLRVEHQTLQRLPQTGAILFGIRIHRTRLDEAARDPETARAILGAIETMAPAMQRYKSLSLVREATLAYLATRLRSS